jgi:Protein of unknown function (DUF2950)
MNTSMNRWATLTAASLIFVGVSRADADGEKFNSANQAAQALVRAAESGDSNAIIRVLGPSAKDIIITSDPVADTKAREGFIRRAKEKVLVAANPKDPTQRILKLGNDGWPLPVPIVEDGGKWRFDADAGKQEILLRRIGDNELTALDVSRGYVEAQDNYFEDNPTHAKVRQYAQRFISTAGTKDGLYWPATAEGDDSPIGELIAKAIAEGYANKNEPYHGYYFKILKSQGTSAPGGPLNYMDGTAMTRGFALIAWPAEYANTGVMTFLVNKTGIVYQKDLGDDTVKIASATMVYDPDPSWTPVAGSGAPK